MTVEHNHLTKCQLPPSILQYLPIARSKVVDATQHGQSHYGRTARLTIQLPSGLLTSYFLKILEGELGMITCRGEYESLKSIYSVCAHTPAPVGWGRYTEDNIDYSFLLVEFLAFQKQPADAKNLAASLAELHLKSQSPTGKFGFHVPTCHTRNVQAVDLWTDSWCELFSSHLSRIISHAQTAFMWPEFDHLGKLVLSKVVPALLLPLQTDGRSIKPCLVHGDCWDGNTATGEDGRAFFFDVASFYAHNEYDLGNWRAPRHAVSDPAYTDAYKALIPVSEPGVYSTVSMHYKKGTKCINTVFALISQVEDWNSRNLLYSLTWNICNALFVPHSTQKPQVFKDMIILCERVCPDDLDNLLSARDKAKAIMTDPSIIDRED